MRVVNHQTVEVRSEDTVVKFHFKIISLSVQKDYLKICQDEYILAAFFEFAMFEILFTSRTKCLSRCHRTCMLH